MLTKSHGCLQKSRQLLSKTPSLLAEFEHLQYDLQRRLHGQYDEFLKKAEAIVPANERIRYWFLDQQREKLSLIFACILEISDSGVV